MPNIQFPVAPDSPLYTPPTYTPPAGAVVVPPFWATNTTFKNEVSVVTNPTQVQSGWQQVAGQKYGQVPPFQWENWLRYSAGQWLGYAQAGLQNIHQSGISIWDNITIYQTGSYAQVSGVIYKSIVDNNLNNNPTSTTGFWVGGAGAIRTNIRIITTNGSYAPSQTSLLFATVITIGGGGGGGSIGAGGGYAFNGAGGGGSGGYSFGILSLSQIGSNQQVTIGSGGIPSSGSTIPSGNGGSTSFGSLVIANGGVGGVGYNTTTSSPGGNGASIIGAIGTNGYVLNGYPGAVGFAVYNGVTGAPQGFSIGGTGGSIYGSGISGGYSAPQQAVGARQPGKNGLNYGDGGSGAAYYGTYSTVALGGMGSNGVIIVIEFLSV